MLSKRAEIEACIVDVALLGCGSSDADVAIQSSATSSSTTSVSSTSVSSGGDGRSCVQGGMTGTGSGASTTGSGTAGSGGQGVVVPEMTGAPCVTITEIALYQGVKRQLMALGQPTSSSIPIVVGATH